MHGKVQHQHSSGVMIGLKILGKMARTLALPKWGSFLLFDLWHIERCGRREDERSNPVHAESNDGWREKQMNHGKHSLDCNLMSTCLPEGWYVQTRSQESHIKIFPSGWHSSNQKYTKIKQNHIYFLFYMCKQHNLQMWNAFRTSLLSSQSYYESKHLFDKLKSAEKQRLQIHKAEECHIHLIWKSWEYEKDSTWLMFLQLTLFFFFFNVQNVQLEKTVSDFIC